MSEPLDSARVRVLLADGDARDVRHLGALLSSWNYAVEIAPDGEAAYRRLTASQVDILVTELILRRTDGFELLRRLRSLGEAPVAIALTALGENAVAADAARELGAFAYCVKPVDPDALRGLLDRAARQRNLRRESTSRAISALAGETEEMKMIFGLLRQVAPSSAPVLITGESGTGKELVARALHLMSPRRAMPFIAINCAAFPEGLVETELFGHERGAFTGAVERRAGCLELASGGTLLLDEVGELPLQAQAKLLRVLDDSRVRRIGGRSEVQLDVRVVAATNRDPSEAVRSGQFRQDLFYRLNVFQIALPPLRERKDDLPGLCGVLLEMLNRKHGRSVCGVDGGVLECFRQYSWPGNVRELRNVLETAVIFAGSGRLGIVHLPERFIAGVVRQSPGAAPLVRGGSVTLTLGTTVDQAERALIEFTLQQTNNNKSRAAKVLGISPKTLHCKIRQYRAQARTAAAS